MTESSVAQVDGPGDGLRRLYRGKSGNGGSAGKVCFVGHTRKILTYSKIAGFGWFFQDSEFFFDSGLVSRTLTVVNQEKEREEGETETVEDDGSGGTKKNLLSPYEYGVLSNK